MQYYETDLTVIATAAEGRDEENDHFLRSLTQYNDDTLDAKVHEINNRVSAGVDCTACGRCCEKLVINITHEEIDRLADVFEMPVPELKEQYIEESLAGNCYINSVPCHFFAEKKCTIYEHRFTECRDFPHLHKPGFRKRFLGTLMHYGNCPIIYNVVEELKVELGFKG